MKKSEVEPLNNELNGQWAKLVLSAHRFNQQHPIATNPRTSLPHSQVSSVDDLLEIATNALPELKGVCRKVAKELNGRCECNIKSKKRILEQMQNEKSPPSLEDPVRGTIILKKASQLHEAMELLKSEFAGITTERIKTENYFSQPLDTGFIGIQFETLIPTELREEVRFVRVEVQLHTEESYKAREQSHLIYERLRALTGNSEFSDRGYINYLKSRINSLKIFNEAYKKIT